LLAAILHDTIEDTGTRPEEIAALFGEEVLALVQEVSDDKSLPKMRRKELQIEHAPGLSAGAKRLKLASHVWEVMKKTDSRECRNCHDYDSMDFTTQGRRAMSGHSVGLEEGQTCIDCHKGIAHRLPDMHEVDPTVVVGQR
jgi:hypothetical protein